MSYDFSEEAKMTDKQLGIGSHKDADLLLLAIDLLKAINEMSIKWFNDVDGNTRVELMALREKIDELLTMAGQ